MGFLLRLKIQKFNISLALLFHTQVRTYYIYEDFIYEPRFSPFTTTPDFTILFSHVAAVFNGTPISSATSNHCFLLNSSSILLSNRSRSETFLFFYLYSIYKWAYMSGMQIQCTMPRKRVGHVFKSLVVIVHIGIAGISCTIGSISLLYNVRAPTCEKVMPLNIWAFEHFYRNKTPS